MDIADAMPTPALPMLPTTADFSHPMRRRRSPEQDNLAPRAPAQQVPASR